MKKKFLRAVALAMAASFCLVGCGSADDSADPTNTPKPTSKPADSSSSSSDNSGSTDNSGSGDVADNTEEGLYKKYDLGGVTITLLDQSDLSGKNPENTEEEYQKEERQAHLDYIEDKYNVNLEFVKVPTDDWDNMPAEIVSAYTSGNPVADVMDAYYQQIDTYVANDILYDMSDAFAKSGAFNPNAYFSWCGSQWGVSLGMGGEGLYYNKTWIKELGMEKTPAEMFDMGMWDYDSCYEYLKELKSKMAADEYPLFVAPGYWALWATHANGVKIWQDNGNLGYIEEPFIETMEFIQKLVNEGLSAIPDSSVLDDGRISYNNWGYPGSTFDAGETIAISHRAAWQAASLVDKFELGYVPYPWGSNVGIDESLIGQPGAYLTLDERYMGSYYDGQAMVLTKGIEKKADPIAVMTMMTELMGWDSVMNGYVAPEESRSCAWLEDGIDKDLYFFQSDRQTCEFYNSIKSVELTVSFNQIIYQNKSVRSELESYYQADMAAMIEAGYASLDMMTPVE